MPTPSLRFFVGLLCAFGLFVGGGLVFFLEIMKPEAVSEASMLAVETVPVTPEPEMKRVPIPDEVRGIYWTAQTAGSARADELLAYIEEGGLNAVVVDLKMDNGEVAFLPNDLSMVPYAQETPAIEDLDALLEKIGEADVYRIARVPVMRDGSLAIVDPELALRTASGAMWRDNIGSLWVDPAAPEVAEYAIAMGREAYERGFDEIQYDYVRFASDGLISSIVYPVYDGTSTKIEVMQTFFETVGGTLKEEGIPVSFDLFGITFWSTDDYNIGQRLVDAIPYADYVSPMVYPSHYPNGFEGYGNPALYPYDIINKTLEKGVALLETELGMLPEESRPMVRPWIQDFDLGATYDAAKIEAQIQAVRDAGGSGWMLWNARNVYEPANYR